MVLEPTIIGQRNRKKYWWDFLKTKNITVNKKVKILVLLEKRATRDSLSGLIKGDEFRLQIKYYESFAKKLKKDVYIFFYDINYLKRTNDTKGYKEGDKLIKNASKTIKESNPKYSLHARWYDGDEMVSAVMLSRNKEKLKKQIENIISKFKINMIKNNVSFCYGYEKLLSNFDETVITAQNKMKAQKLELKIVR